jgi:glucose/arabinose dehydrogenase
MAVEWRTKLAGVVAGGLLLSGCANFPQQPPPENWEPQEQLTPQAAPDPQVPGQPTGPGEGGGQQEPQEVPPPDGCTDFNPIVIGTCLDTITAVAALPGDGQHPVALVGERRTGRILRVQPGAAPELVATVPVDSSTDGGLTGLALSPAYAEDQLIFAYITTASDNRVVRIAPGDTPKPVLTGIPRGATGNRGSLTQDRRGGLLVATGDAGSPTSAGDLNSLAGKVLMIDAAGRPTAGPSVVVAAGLRSPGGICSSMDGQLLWVTDRAAEADVLYRIQPGQPLSAPAWTWPERPGVAGCASTPEMMWVFMEAEASQHSLPMTADGTFTDKPTVSMAPPNGFGRWGAVDLVNASMGIAGTVNKAGGTPVSSDDRAVVILFPQGGGTAGKD